MLSKTTVGLAAAGAGLCFIGYCIYFDHKRRSDPLFRQKLREKRRKTKQSKSSSSGPKIPELNSAEDMQRFFMQEVQLGEELLASGDTEGGVEHLTNAISVCGEPQRLLQALQQTLPPHVFQMIFQRLMTMQQSSPFGMSTPTTKSEKVTVIEDDVE